jgi:hypothetical protein
MHEFLKLTVKFLFKYTTQNIKKINLKIHKIIVKIKINPLLKLHSSIFCVI